MIVIDLIIFNNIKNFKLEPKISSNYHRLLIFATTKAIKKILMRSQANLNFKNIFTQIIDQFTNVI